MSGSKFCVNVTISLTLILQTWIIWRAPNNASKWLMVLNSAFKGLTVTNDLSVRRDFFLPLVSFQEGRQLFKHISSLKDILTLSLLMSCTYMERLFLMLLDHTQRRTTVGRTSLDEWSARRRDLYLTTHDIHNRQISMPPVGFEPTIYAGERSTWAG